MTTITIITGAPPAQAKAPPPRHPKAKLWHHLKALPPEPSIRRQVLLMRFLLHRFY